MADVIRRVDLIATFSKMKVGDIVEVSFDDATESNVRTAASRYSISKKAELRVSAPLGATATKISRIA